ncbi:MAG: hypothetical protein AB7F31_00165 [Parachlamydiales bacterium]
MIATVCGRPEIDDLARSLFKVNLMDVYRVVTRRVNTDPLIVKAPVSRMIFEVTGNMGSVDREWLSPFDNKVSLAFVITSRCNADAAIERTRNANIKAGWNRRRCGEK